MNENTKKTGNKNKKEKKKKPLFDLETEVGRLKLEIAEELGLREKIEKTGWKSLTSRESGAIGGKIAGKIDGKNLQMFCKLFIIN